MRGYDYSRGGAYFVTFCVNNRECLLGEVAGGMMLMNEYGRVAAKTLEWLTERYPYVGLDESIVMPNHVHAIITINRSTVVGAVREPPADRVKPLGRVIGAFKTVSTKTINQMRGTLGATVRQRDYYEHIIRGDNDLQRIREYICRNPRAWLSDPENPCGRRIRDGKSGRFTNRPYEGSM